MERLLFAKLGANLDVGFWEELRQRKVRDWKLSEPTVRISGRRLGAGSGPSAPAHHTIFFNRDSFEASPSVLTDPSTPRRRPFPCWLTNYDEMQALSAPLDADGLLLDALWTYLLRPLLSPARCSSSSGGSSSDVTAGEPSAVEEEEEASVARAWVNAPYAFAILRTTVDAKRYLFQYRLAFPSAALRDSPIMIDNRDGLMPLSKSTVAALCAYAAPLAHHALFPFLATVNTPSDAGADGPPLPASCEPFTPAQLAAFVTHGAAVRLCLYDEVGGTGNNSVSWGVRNFLLCLRLALPWLHGVRLIVLRHRRSERGEAEGGEEFLDLPLRWDPTEDTGTPNPGCVTESIPESLRARLKVTGWRAKAAQSIDLNAMINPIARADADARFNLELMRWRLLPSLQLGGLASARVLLLGAGTLGCHVGRALLSWGVRHITFVDRGAVRFSNLARQSLFTAEDAAKGRGKAEAAAAALQAIIPSAAVQHSPLSIPMPGHRIDPTQEADALADVDQLVELIGSHDVVLLLLDSREGRWLPSLVAAARGVPVLTVAIGLHSYVVMRHGVVSSGSTSNALRYPEVSGDTAAAANAVSHTRMSCYFCADLAAPMDSMSARTLDQQCTVTRPGVAEIASAVAVELLAQLYQHPLGFCCPPSSGAGGGHQALCLGHPPQQIRGSVLHHSSSTLCGERSPYCTACAAPLLAAYREGGSRFLLSCINSQRVIEEVCGLARQQQLWREQADAFNDLEISSCEEGN